MDSLWIFIDVHRCSMVCHECLKRPRVLEIPRASPRIQMDYSTAQQINVLGPSGVRSREMRKIMSLCGIYGEIDMKQRCGGLIQFF